MAALSPSPSPKAVGVGDDSAMTSSAPETTWQERVCRGLLSSEVRSRLNAYSLLSARCSDSKQAQLQVGQLLQGPDHADNGASPTTGTPLLAVLFEDLLSTDRTLRIAAARVLSLVAYENLVNQQIIQSRSEGGVTVGWVHVFSIPQALRSTSADLAAVVTDLVTENYASIYRNVSRYYVGGCRDFLPLCWSLPLSNGSVDVTERIEVPDPSENLLGFYLVPRQTQFPEQNGLYLQELLRSMRTEVELARLQQVHGSFQVVAAQSPTKDVTSAALRSALAPLYDGSEAAAGDKREPIGRQDALQWLAEAPDRIISWNELLIWCCTTLNADEMSKRFGAETYRAVGSLFQQLALEGADLQQPRDLEQAYAWESVLVSAVLSHPTLPSAFKTQVRQFSSRIESRFEVTRGTGSKKSVTSSNDSSSSVFRDLLKRPWESLLPLDLVDVHPISWSVFLSKWRLGADTEPAIKPEIIYHHRRIKRNSIATTADSVSSARKNALVAVGPSHRIFHSCRDLNQLRQQLPLIAKESEAPATFSHVKHSSMGEEEKRELAATRSFFRRLQQSTVEVDELTRQHLDDKQMARSKALQDAAVKRQKAEALVEQRRRALERKQLDKTAQVQALEQRREHQYRISSEAKQERQLRVHQRLRSQHEAYMARQQQQRQQQESEGERRPVTTSPRRTPTLPTGRSAESTADDPNLLDLQSARIANACDTLVMANAVNTVAQEIAIPQVAAPILIESSLSPAVVMAQYSALEQSQRIKLHERYQTNRVSHKLMFAVLQQLTHEMRQDAAWREFQTAAVGAASRKRSKSEAKVTYTSFAFVAEKLGVSMPPRKLQAAARSLDTWKTGFVAWEQFYAWWSCQ
ncbi:hypothetical protein BBJ28_00002311 [Nothophytophthora sp. Chile5]|nr:hypothetical protein BBJ28_00002311 [Nothophytophthora sp. Chile5]